MVLPLELLQQFKDSDFSDQLEYEGWKARNLKVLQAGLLHHPLVPLDKSDTASERFHQFIVGASDRSIVTGKSSDMQLLCSILLPLTYRSLDGRGSDTCHWADGFPFNLHLYQMLLEICFNSNIAEGAMIDEIDQVLELIKKTWAILGINQSLHNLCFTWILFHKFAATMQVENDLVFEVDNQLIEVANDAKATQDPAYSKILSSILTSIIGWTEKKLIAYHDTFNQSNIEYMQVFVSLGVKTAKIQVEDLSNEYGWKKGEETDISCSIIDSYIRSSLRTAFAQKMKQRETSWRSSIDQNTPVLSILAKDVGALAIKEKQLFSPILKKWHPLAAGVAVATLHFCYANELKQYIYGLVELTPDIVQVLKAADKLEKDLVNIAVEDSVDSDDGGMSLIREMSPYEVESAIMDLVRAWINTRIDRLKEWIDENLQQEV
ncbi:hypothetical protein ZIOFF_043367 [Zingiber officinale]|uniref:MHD1 domain-containing protein n=1 Tax=Zingiber officinale TaxID=94328 RepID=A0A8J5FX64_ZINOF|nr:hypothetical protein ZIOFF_043367 [Zingiber officinale]